MNQNEMGRAIAGVGAVAAIGDTAATVFDALCAGQSGVAELRRFDTREYRTQHGYPMANQAPDRPAYATRWLIETIAEAAAQAGLGDDLTGIPVIVGTGLRELRSVELAWQAGHEGGAPDLDFGPALRERFGCAEVHTVANACAASLHALGMADDLLTLGRADTVVVAGVDTIAVSMFAALDVVQPRMTALRPFDARHKGVLMGDGAAAIVLRRDGPALARLRGVGISCDAGHVTAPDPVGIVAAMHDAHRRAGVRPTDVDLVLAHGTGTALNDAAEATALTDVFGAARPLVTAIKAMTGHTSGSSGMLSLVAAVASLRTGRVPPIPDLVTPIHEARTLRLATEPTELAVLGVAQVNSFGFGGVNAVAIVEGAS
ncbi:beta-ketoacyl-[acyl-carrier-protein] synthase family protein [Nocardia sp. NPDC051321]|uniref:beta-ketoacyl-[acyl-carrier-protein] synthase family protein n=1 Tax=Nocardia sp. NPDC051321 TaxID=3364323 RepID=UPI0037A08605